MVSGCQAHISYTVTLKQICVLHLMWDLVYDSRCVQIFASLRSSCLSRSKLESSQSFGLIILVYCFPTKSIPKLKGSKEYNFTHQQFGNDFYLFHFIKYLKGMNNIFTIEKSRYSFSVPQLFIQFRYSLNIRLFLLHHFHEFSFSIGIQYSRNGFSQQPLGGKSFCIIMDNTQGNSSSRAYRGSAHSSREHNAYSFIYICYTPTCLSRDS